MVSSFNDYELTAPMLALKPTILVVEDNPVERQLLCKILRNSEFDVIAVDRGGIVLETFIEHQPDLILLDALLPDIDGFGVCESLRAHPRGMHTPVIMLTGLDDMNSINRSYEAGATDFFTKPINHTLLVYRIRYLLRARQIMDQLRVSQQSFANAQKVAKLGHWEFDSETKEFTISDEVYRLYGLEPSEQDGKTSQVLSDRCFAEDYEIMRRVVYGTVEEQQEGRGEYRIRWDDGSEHYMELHTTLLREERAETHEKHTKVLGIIADRTAVKLSEKEILSLAYIDRLTGLSNRSLLETFLNTAIPAAHYQGLSVAIVSIDLDHFNLINNSMGHSAGDAVLRQLAARLSGIGKCCDVDDLLDKLAVSELVMEDVQHNLLARLLADTFAFVVVSVDRQSDNIESLSHKIKQSFETPFNYRGQELFVTSSIGITYSESGSTVVETLLQQADLALHEAKDQGRNEVQEYSRDLVSKVSKHLVIQSEMRKAIREGEFQLYYQPKIATATGEISGFEALVRWIHPEKGMIPPDQFIPVAETTGQIVDLGMWVLETACAQNKQWVDDGLVNVRVAVNVAARQFKEGNLVEIVESILERTGLSEQNLELEITEGVLMADPRSSDFIEKLRDRGITIALDDFGTGYSSLSYITRFPIDTIKIDRSFVQDIQEGSEKATIVSAVNGLAHGLGFKVVAEGVETDSELRLIEQLGCDEIQGYYYCRPMPADDIREWIKNREPRDVSIASPIN